MKIKSIFITYLFLQSSITLSSDFATHTLDSDRNTGIQNLEKTLKTADLLSTASLISNISIRIPGDLRPEFEVPLGEQGKETLIVQLRGFKLKRLILNSSKNYDFCKTEQKPSTENSIDHEFDFLNNESSPVELRYQNPMCIGEDGSDPSLWPEFHPTLKSTIYVKEFSVNFRLSFKGRRIKADASGTIKGLYLPIDFHVDPSSQKPLLLTKPEYRKREYHLDRIEFDLKAFPRLSKLASKALEDQLQVWVIKALVHELSI